MQLEIPIDVKVTAQASSHFTREMIDARLAVLAGREDRSAVEERKYLERLKTQ